MPDRSKKRKKGALPGNKNALKFGYYTRRLPKAALEGLEETSPSSLNDEIEVMRIFSRKVAELGSDVDNLGEATDVLRVLALSTNSINRLVRTNATMPETTQADVLKQALEELEQEWPEFKAFTDDFRTDSHPPVVTPSDEDDDAEDDANDTDDADDPDDADNPDDSDDADESGDTHDSGANPSDILAAALSAVSSYTAEDDAIVDPATGLPLDLLDDLPDDPPDDPSVEV